MPVTVSGLYHYPLKSGSGLSSESIEVLTSGVRNDRRMMLVDQNGKFVTQRAIPAMALLKTRTLDDSSWELSYAGNSFIWEERFDRPAATQIWQDQVTAYDQGDDAAEFLKSALGDQLRLVMEGSKTDRPVDPQKTPQPMTQLFADAYPYLFTSESSLAELNRRIPGRESVPMNRFRPNIVLAGLEPAFAEDGVHRLTIDGCIFEMTIPCVRCVVTTTDQLSGKRGKEPIKTLASFRNLPGSGGICFGMNAILVEGAGQHISVGSAVTIQYR